MKLINPMENNNISSLGFNLEFGTEHWNKEITDKSMKLALERWLMYWGAYNDLLDDLADYDNQPWWKHLFFGRAHIRRIQLKSLNELMNLKNQNNE